ncbi:unnamed protein product [Rhizophagus irregularis]|nr:unnamed protein product [Rhizophagus irregularis]
MNEHKIPTILIIGAGPGGLTLAHSIQKNLNSFEKKFNLKIFDREISPNDKWQGYHITLNNTGVKSLFNYDDNVWAIFDDGTRERGDLLIGADGIHSPIRKQKIPELKINHLGITQCCADIIPNKELMDHSNDNNNNETSYYRVSFAYSYPSENHEKNDNWTYKDDELPTSKFPDDENPEFVFNDIKKRIKENRPKGKLTDIFLEFWDLAKSRIENDHENCYPLRRRPLRDIDPGSVDQWETTRVTLLGDAIHAMNPWVGIGTNSAIEDAELLTNALANWSKDNWKEHIRNYELGLRGRGSFYIDLTRTSCIKKHQICDENVILLTKTIKSWWYERMRTWYGDRKERGMDYFSKKIQIMDRTSDDGKERANVNKKHTNYEYGDGKERDDISKK